jgi:hypothetical protein
MKDEQRGLALQPFNPQVTTKHRNQARTNNKQNERILVWSHGTSAHMPWQSVGAKEFET